jgi:Domain of unknown function (DUF1906)
MYSRRKVLQSLGLAAAGLALPGRAFARVGLAGQTLGCAQNRAQLIDADFAVTRYVEKIKATGVKTIARYYDREYGSGTGEKCWHNPTKTLTKPELTAIEDAGLSVVTLFQHCNADCMNFSTTSAATADKGAKDALGAIQRATDLGQPADTPVYFGIDFNPVQYGDCKQSNDQIWSNIAAYFGQINEAFARTRWRVGIYGCGRTLRFLRDRKLAKYFWLSASMAHEETDEFFNSGEWHIFQNRIDIQKDYARKNEELIDSNVVNPSNLDADPNGPYFGQWTTKGRGEAHDVGDSFDILTSRAFFKRACGYNKDASGKLQPQASRVIFDSTCRVMTKEADGYFGISITEGDEVEGYVHQSDIVPGGLWRNMPRYNASNVCAPAPTKSDVPAVSILQKQSPSKPGHSTLAGSGS